MPGACRPRRAWRPWSRRLDRGASVIYWHKALLLLFLLVVLPAAVYGLWAQYRNATRITPEIARTLVAPYAEAVRAGDYEGAYRRYTSAAFKAAVSFDRYVRAQQHNLEDLGTLQSVEVRETEPFQSAGNLFSGRRWYQGGLDWRGARRPVWVQWEVVEEGGGYRIEAMYEVHEETLSPRVF